MTSSFQGGTFNPVAQPDYVTPAEQNAKQQIQNFGRYVQLATAANNRKAELAGSELAKLAKFSKSLEGITQQFQDRRDENRQAEAREWYLENGLSDDQLEEYNNKRNKLKEQDQVLHDIANKDEELKNDPELKDRFVSLSKWKQQLIIEFEAERRAKTFLTEPDPQLDAALDSTEYNSLMNLKTSAFLKQFDGLSNALKEKHVHSHILKTRDAHYKNWKAKRNNEILSEQIVTTIGYTNTKLQSQAVDSLEFYTTERNKIQYASSAQIRKEYADTAKAFLQRSDSTTDQLDAIGNQMVWDDNKKEDVLLKDHYAWKGTFEDLTDAFNAAKRQDYKQETTDKKIAGQKFVSTELEKIKTEDADGTDFSTQTKNELIKEVYDNYPETAESLIRQIENTFNFTNDQKVLEDKSRQQAQVLISANQFDSYQLSLLPTAVQQDTNLQKSAKFGDAQLVNRNAAYTYISDSLKSASSESSFTRLSPGLPDLEQRFISEYDNLVLGLTLNQGKTNEEAHELAFKEIKEFLGDRKNINTIRSDLKNNTNNLKDWREDEIGTSGIAYNKEWQTKADNKRRVITDYQKAFGDKALLIPAEEDGTEKRTFFFSESEIKKIQKDLQEGKLSANPKVQLIQKAFGISYRDVINKQLKAFGEKTLGKSESFDAYDKLDDTHKFIIDSAQSNEEVARGWGYTPEQVKTVEQFKTAFEKSIVPNGLGESIDKADIEESEKPILAAVFEITAKHPEFKLFSKNPEASADDFSASIYKDYWMSRFKFSKGTDLTALTELRRF
tara:strand:- start:3846 stop:6197 length:2352 start_codon:yes stop_codon:yes gene_type:complete